MSKPTFPPRRLLGLVLPVLLPAAALAGDAEWGAFLAGECASCHRAEATHSGIPSIHGLPAETFIMAMEDYRSGLRPNETMRTIASRLGDDEIAALAAHFARLDAGGGSDKETTQP